MVANCRIAANSVAGSIADTTTTITIAGDTATVSAGIVVALVANCMITTNLLHLIASVKAACELVESVVKPAGAFGTHVTTMPSLRLRL